MIKKNDTVQTLLDALPFIKEFNNQIVVIKYGGSAQTSPELVQKFAEDISLLYTVGIKPVIVHGGGKKINDMLEALNIETSFIDGQRVTTPEVMRIAEMVLGGEINKEIVSLLNSHSIKAIGISGKDAHFIKAEPKCEEKWGLTGNITEVNAEIVHNLIKDGYVPIIAPIAAGDNLGHSGFNINADLAASFIAKSIGANKVVFLTDTPGVLDANMELLSTLSEDEVIELKDSGVINGGMVPKVDACLEAVEGGVPKAHIIDGRIEHSILLELFTSDGIGTVIKLEN
ncbi:MAG: acetylglutamate kinase [Helicobacteraceae bacterium]|nr:acetylglutamate kinase [Helicobacteraceae bacterium]